MKKILSVQLCLLLGASSAFANVQPSDFFCTPTPLQGTPMLPGMHPMMPAGNPNLASPSGPLALSFRTQVKDCGKETVVAENVCLITAACVYLSPAIKKELEGKNPQQMQEHINRKAREVGIGRENPYDVVRTDMFCTGRVEHGKLLCPPPELCKGDLLHNAQFAVIETPKMKFPQPFRPTDPEPTAAGTAQ